MGFQELLARRGLGQSFIFGGNTGNTYEGLQQKRQTAQMIAPKGTPRNIGEGLSALGQAFAYRKLMGDVEAGEAKGREAFQGQFDALMGGGSQPRMSFNDSLARTESGGDYTVTNSEGYGGKYQFGQARLDDFNRANGTKFKVADLTSGTPESKALTEQVQNWHVADIDGFVRSQGLDQYIGQNVGGVTLTQDSLRAMAHLGGKGGMRAFLESGGQHNPQDSNGTSLSDYARTHAGAPSASMNPQLISLMSNPYASDGQRALMQLMLQRQMQRNTPMSAMDTARLESLRLQNKKTQAEINGLENPTPELTDDIREYLFAQRHGYEKSFVDFQTEIKKAGANNTTVHNAPKHSPAKPGFTYLFNPDGSLKTDERGVPLQTVIPGGPEDNAPDLKATSASARDSLNLIDEVLNHPSLAEVTGMFQGRMFARTQSQQDLLIRIEQLQGQAFLQAFETLKGGGQITEREGLAAQAAIARLQRVQSDEAYREALLELREIVARGAERAGADLSTQEVQQSSNNQVIPPTPDSNLGGKPAAGVTEDGYRFIGGDPGDPNNWQKVQ